MSSINTINPATGSALNSYLYMNDDTVGRAVEQADEAFQRWRNLSVQERCHYARALEKALLLHSDDLARLATLEMGKPIDQSIKEVQKCATCCRYYADHAVSFLANDVVKSPQGIAKAYVSFKPLGVVLCIMPWNFPYWQVIRFAVPALMAGNAVVLKHADITTGSALLLERIFKEIFPADLFKVILATHEQISDVLADDRIRAVTLTGSEGAGKKIAARAGGLLKKSVLELGGSDAYVVLADADIKQAARACAAGRLVNTGQSCVAAKRFIVQAEVHSQFVEALEAEFRLRKLGDPAVDDTDIGPLARQDLREGLAAQVDKSVQQGARVVLGGRRANRDGYFYEPTILDGVTPGMAAFDEETFGPVAAVTKAQSESEALRLANKSRFGLGGAIFSKRVDHAEQLAREWLDAGIVAVNGMVASDATLPFGGVKSSGYGRELGSYGIHEFVNIKTVMVHGT